NGLAGRAGDGAGGEIDPEVAFADPPCPSRRLGHRGEHLDPTLFELLARLGVAVGRIAEQAPRTQLLVLGIDQRWRLLAVVVAAAPPRPPARRPGPARSRPHEERAQRPAPPVSTAARAPASSASRSQVSDAASRNRTRGCERDSQPPRHPHPRPHRAAYGRRSGRASPCPGSRRLPASASSQPPARPPPRAGPAQRQARACARTPPAPCHAEAAGRET